MTMGSFAQQTVNGLALGGVYALYTIGFSLVLGNLRIFHLAHAAVFTWGAVFGWQLVDRVGVPLWAALPIAAVLGGVLNVLCYFVLIRHIERRPNKELAGFISSLGGFFALTELAVIALDHKTVRFPVDAFPTGTWSVGPVSVSYIQTAIAIASVVAVLVLRWALVRTEWGREVRTVAYDREAAGILGIDADRISAQVFFVSGMLAGLGAVLVTVAFSNVNGQLGSVYLVVAIAVMVVGGFGSMTGAFYAALLIGVVSAWVTAYVSSSYRDVIVFGILLAFLVVRPAGLFRGSDVVERV
jgi:branched-chain amino acid transport system permease protein